MIAWTTFAITIALFPASSHPTPEDMNYTVAVGGGWIVLCLVYYFCPVYGGKNWFRGPIANVNLLDTIELYENPAAEKDSVEESRDGK